MEPRILALSGSLRRESLNQRLVRIAAEGAREAGATVTTIHLRDFPLPLFDQELEDAEGLPLVAAELRKLFIGSHGLLIASPEYNSSLTAALKNAIDWASRSPAGEPGLVAFRGKVATVMSASPGALGGIRGLVHLRAILGNLGVLVLPEQIALGSAHTAFSPGGQLLDERKNGEVRRLGANLVSAIRRWHG